jgi:hypothetical protein
MRERDYPASAEIPFKRYLRRQYSAKGKNIYIAIGMKGRRRPSGGRTRERFIVSLSVCFCDP